MGNVHFEIAAATVPGPTLPAFGPVLAVRVWQDGPGRTGAHAVTHLSNAAALTAR